MTSKNQFLHYIPSSLLPRDERLEHQIVPACVVVPRPLLAGVEAQLLNLQHSN